MLQIELTTNDKQKRRAKFVLSKHAAIRIERLSSYGGFKRYLITQITEKERANGETDQALKWITENTFPGVPFVKVNEVFKQL